MITHVPDSKTNEIIAQVNNEDEAWENWENDKNIISENKIKHDDGYLQIEEI